MNTDETENTGGPMKLDDEELSDVVGGYKISTKISSNNLYLFKAACAKCGHQERIALEKQEVKTWICVNCKTWNVTKMQSGSTSQCYTYTSNEYERLLKSGISI